MTVFASSTPDEFVSFENHRRVSSETGDSLLARSSSWDQLGSISPSKRMTFGFRWDFWLIQFNTPKLRHTAAKGKTWKVEPIDKMRQGVAFTERRYNGVNIVKR